MFSCVLKRYYLRKEVPWPPHEKTAAAPCIPIGCPALYSANFLKNFSDENMAYPGVQSLHSGGSRELTHFVFTIYLIQDFFLPFTL